MTGFSMKRTHARRMLYSRTELFKQVDFVRVQMTEWLRMNRIFTERIRKDVDAITEIMGTLPRIRAARKYLIVPPSERWILSNWRMRPPGPKHSANFSSPVHLKIARYRIALNHSLLAHIQEKARDNSSRETVAWVHPPSLRLATFSTDALGLSFFADTQLAIHARTTQLPQSGVDNELTPGGRNDL